MASSQQQQHRPVNIEEYEIRLLNSERTGLSLQKAHNIKRRGSCYKQRELVTSKPELPKDSVSEEQYIEFDMLVTAEAGSEGGLFRRKDELRGRCKVAGRSGIAGLWPKSKVTPSAGVRRRTILPKSSSAVANGARPTIQNRKTDTITPTLFIC